MAQNSLIFSKATALPMKGFASITPAVGRVRKAARNGGVGARLDHHAPSWPLGEAIS